MLGILGVILGATAIVLALRKGVEAAPSADHIPTADEIYAAQSIVKLDAYYELINELLLTEQIDFATYSALYSVYETRFYALMEVA